MFGPIHINAVPLLNNEDILFSLLGGFIVVFGLLSFLIKERLFLSEAFLATLLGIVISPVGLNFLNPNLFASPNHVLFQLSRIVIAVSVFAAGVESPKNYILREARSMLVLLLPVLTWMWLISGLVIYFCFDLSFLQSLVIAACLSATDPVLANSIVKGRFADRHIPLNVRLILSAESGANDGLGFPFLFLALYLLRSSVSMALKDWVFNILLYQIVFSIVLGIFFGYFARIALQYADKHKWIDKENFLSFGIALTFLILGCVGLLGSDDILSVFIAGNVLTWDGWFNDKVADAKFQETIDSLFNLSFFIYFGSIIPWVDIGSPDLSLWRLFLAAILILLFRRLPIVVALLRFIPTIRTVREGIFLGWFGPMGVGALYYAVVAMETIQPEGSSAPEFGKLDQLLFPIVCFLVLSSVVVHGITVPLFHLGFKSHEKRRANSPHRVLRSFGDGTTDTSIPQALIFEASNTLSGSDPMLPSSAPQYELLEIIPLKSIQTGNTSS